MKARTTAFLATLSLFLVLILLGQFSVIGSVKAASTFTDKLNDAGIDGWSGNSYGGFKHTTSNTYEGAGAMWCDVSDVKSGYRSYLSHGGPSGPSKVTYFMRYESSFTSSTAHSHGSIKLHDSGGSEQISNIGFNETHVSIDAGGTLQYYPVSFNTDTYYKVQLKINSSTYDVEITNVATDTVVFNKTGISRRRTNTIEDIEFQCSSAGGSDWRADYVTTGDIYHTVSGYVHDSTGDALPNTTVSTNTSKSSNTSNSGSYSLSLSDGEYTLTASKKAYVNKTKNVTISGSSISGVNFTLKQVPVEGYVKSPTGSEIPNASVILEYAENNTAISSTKTDTNGYYSFSSNTNEEAEVIISKSGYSSEIERLSGSNASFTLEQTSVSSGIVIESNNVNLGSVTVANVGNAGVLLNGTGAELSGVTVLGGKYGIVVKQGAGTHKLKDLNLGQSAFAGVKNEDAEMVTVEGSFGTFVDTVGNVVEG